MTKLFDFTERVPEIYKDDKKLVAKQKDGHQKVFFSLMNCQPNNKKFVNNLVTYITKFKETWIF